MTLHLLPQPPDQPEPDQPPEPPEPASLQAHINLLRDATDTLEEAVTAEFRLVAALYIHRLIRSILSTELAAIDNHEKEHSS